MRRLARGALLGSAALVQACNLFIGIDGVAYDLPEGMVEYEGADGARLFIDATEVTMTAYGQWLDDGERKPQRSVCSWNESFVPADPKGATGEATIEPYCTADLDWPVARATTPNFPVTCVDWCDAVAYCDGVGKHLCGGVGGKSLVLSMGTFTYPDPKASAWYLACSDNGKRTYPYGDEYDVAACNADTGTRFDVGAEPSCEGGSPRLFDMSGNAEEWEDGCQNDAPQTGCPRRGGAYYSAQPGVARPDELRCEVPSVAGRMDMGASTGFRCCWEP